MGVSLTMSVSDIFKTLLVYLRVYLSTNEQQSTHASQKKCAIYLCSYIYKKLIPLLKIDFCGWKLHFKPTVLPC